MNIFLDNSGSKHVTVTLNRVRVYDAIAFLAHENGLTVTLDGGIFRIMPPLHHQPQSRHHPKSRQWRLPIIFSL